MQSLSLIDMIANAGLMVKFVMFLLLGFSVVSWTIIFMKFKLFKDAREDSDKFLQTFWKCKNLDDAKMSAKASLISPEAAIFNMGYSELRRLNQSRAATHPGEETLDMQLASMDNLKRTLRKAENLESARFGKSLAFLATTGSSTPFIGLFGTVWGIMASFHEIGMRGSASLAVVAPGISEALVATAAGLAAAIPAVIFYNHYSNQLADMESEMQNFSSDFLNLAEREFFS